MYFLTPVKNKDHEAHIDSYKHLLPYKYQRQNYKPPQRNKRKHQ